MESEANADLELLLTHDAWVRRLARRLVADREQADDLVQETWLSALRSTCSGRGAPRAFLAGVLRKRALQQWRSEGRRRDCEARAEPPRAEPSVADALERAELGRELARLALELEEPFRSAVLLRYFSDLSVRDIAERLDVSAKTVESRLARGQARLRERWERRHPGEHGAWLALLAGWPARWSVPPTAATTAGSAAPALGVLIVNTKLVLGALAVLGGGGLLWLAASLSDPPEPRDLPLRSAVEARPRPVATRSAEVAPSASRDPGERTTLVPTAPPAAPAGKHALDERETRRALAGRVVDAEARAVPGVPVAFTADRGEEVRAVSDGAGRFELDAPARFGRVASVDPELEDLYALHARANSSAELLLIVARHRPLSGVVRDESGAPVREARVRLELPAGFASRFDAVLDAADDRTWSVSTDADGRFALERVPVVEDALLVARLDGYEPATLQPPPRADAALELVLRRPDSSESILAGRVSSAAGAPVQGALVSLGERSARTAEDGTFRLDREGAHDSFELTAVHQGHLPALLRAVPGAATGAPAWPDWIELVLGGPTLSLAGRVVDADGRPRAGVRLWLDDPTEFGRVGEDLWVQLENLAAPADSTYSTGSDDYFRWTATDADGRFELQGLLEREYTLGVLDPESALVVRSGPHAAGRADLSIALPERERHTVAATIRSRAGALLEGLSVALHCPQFGGVQHRYGERTTDAEGRFAFEGIAGDELTLWIRGEGVVPSVQRVTWAAGEEGEVVVDVLCHLKVDFSPRPDLADRVYVVDREGQRLGLRDIGANGVHTRYSWELIDGRTITLGVSDTADQLVLTREGTEVRRVPLHLAPDRLEVVRP